LTGAATVKAVRMVDTDEAKNGRSGDRVQVIKDRARLVWKLYIPPVTSGVATIGSIIAATKLGNRKAAAAITAYSLTERAFSEYKDKVVEQIGENKERKIRDEIAQEAVDRKPPSGEVIIATGQVLCCELYTGRYFTSDMETLRQAANNMNFEAMSGIHATLADFYYAIGLGITSESTEMGWENDRLMELKFTTTLTPDGKPCLAFNYNYVKPL